MGMNLHSFPQSTTNIHCCHLSEINVDKEECGDIAFIFFLILSFSLSTNQLQSLYGDQGQHVFFNDVLRKEKRSFFCSPLFLIPIFVLFAATLIIRFFSFVKG